MKDKLYINNQYLIEIQAKVLLSEKIDDNYHILLDRTIFYPEGLGGQKGDQGTLNGKKILRSYQKDSRIYHVVKERIDSDQVLLKINWENRLHIMQQHTCQHLVSACFYRLYAIDTLSFHASEDHITIDFDIDSVNPDQIEKVEDLANLIIQNNLQIKTYFPSLKELEKINLRRQAKVKENIRVVEIDGFDYAACGGTHLSTSGQLGLIKITDWNKQNGKLRIFVKSGQEALTDYRNKENIYKVLSADLSANPENLLDKYTSFKEKNQDLEQSYSKLKDKYLDLLAQEIINQSKNKDKPLYTGEFADLEFSNVNLLLKKLSKQDLILGLYKQEKDIFNFSISLNGRAQGDLAAIKSYLDQNFNLKAGGSKKFLQGLIISKDKEKVKEFFATELEKLI